ncbi:alpha/beta fold hydrolase [Gordonia humi]|uniref:alpha/beta fold hydrolase n=1 Tax=Gordonia humi TaxID=686429 RepID=UPI00361B1339
MLRVIRADVCGVCAVARLACPVRSEVTEWVLVRGLTREQRHWHDLPIILAELGERVTCIDAPGFGTEHTRRSPSTIREITDDMRDRLPFAHEDRAILGISLGGMVALDWCSRYPYDFSLCAVVNTLARDVFRPKYLTRGALTVLALRRFRSLRGHERAVAQLTVASASVDSEELVRQWVNFHHDAPPTEASVRAQALAGLRFRLPETLPTPSLLSPRAATVSPTTGCRSTSQNATKRRCFSIRGLATTSRSTTPRGSAAFYRQQKVATVRRSYTSTPGHPPPRDFVVTASLTVQSLHPESCRRMSVQRPSPYEHGPGT